MSWEWSVECAKKPPIIPNRFHSCLYMFTYHLRSIRVFKFLSSCLQIGKAYMTALVLSSTDDRLLRQYALQVTEKRSSPVLCNSGQNEQADVINCLSIRYTPSTKCSSCATIHRVTLVSTSIAGHLVFPREKPTVVTVISVLAAPALG